MQSGKALVGMAQSCSMLLVLFQLYAGAQAQPSPQSVDGRLDASVGAVVASLQNTNAHELVVGHGPYTYWNQVPSREPPNGVAFQAVVGDVITFFFNNENNVFLMANEDDYDKCNFESSDTATPPTLVGPQRMFNTPPGYKTFGLVNVYRAVLKAEGMFYFSCYRPGGSCTHCKFGQKIKVNVSLDRPPASPPAPPLPCNLVENCECACCDGDKCQGYPVNERAFLETGYHQYVHFSFNADSAASCNADACSSEFARCMRCLGWSGFCRAAGDRSPGRPESTRERTESR